MQRNLVKIEHVVLKICSRKKTSDTGRIIITPLTEGGVVNKNDVNAVDCPLGRVVWPYCSLAAFLPRNAMHPRY